METGLLILLPLLGSVLVMFSRGEKTIRRNTLIVALAEFVLSVFAAFKFRNTGLPQQEIELPWIKEAGVNFHFAMDGISLLLVLLTTFLILVIILASFSFQSRRLNLFFGLMLIMESALLAVFSAQDGIIFYIFWELALIPAYFITAIWGGADKIRITFKFFIYTMTGSLLMLGGLIWLYLHTPEPHSAEFSALYKVITTTENQNWLFAAFFFAFAIKIPIVPFHTWQPDTYTEAPAAGSMILAGIMLKMGIYGIIRVLLPLCRNIPGTMQTTIIIVIVAGIIYASVIALTQNDLKRLVAWVSIAHVGLITAGVFTLNETGMNGAVIQLISHGINTVGLFIIIDIIQKRFGTRIISGLGGLSKTSPLLAIMFLIIVLATIAMPLTNSFTGEFLLLAGIFRFNVWLSVFAGTTIIFSAVYMLNMYQKVMLGTYNGTVTEGAELTAAEFISLSLLIVIIFWIGCYPKVFLELAGPAVKTVLSYTNVIPN
jgi:NADH-quinone oxidoreductase subunit M